MTIEYWLGVECLDCEEWEQLPSQEQRHHLDMFEIVEYGNHSPHDFEAEYKSPDKYKCLCCGSRNTQAEYMEGETE